MSQKKGPDLKHYLSISSTDAAYSTEFLQYFLLNIPASAVYCIFWYQ